MNLCWSLEERKKGKKKKKGTSLEYIYKLKFSKQFSFYTHSCFHTFHHFLIQDHEILFSSLSCWSDKLYSWRYIQTHTKNKSTIKFHLCWNNLWQGTLCCHWCWPMCSLQSLILSKGLYFAQQRNFVYEPMNKKTLSVGVFLFVLSIFHSFSWNVYIRRLKHTKVTWENCLNFK